MCACIGKFKEIQRIEQRFVEDIYVPQFKMHRFEWKALQRRIAVQKDLQTSKGLCAKRRPRVLRRLVAGKNARTDLKDRKARVRRREVSPAHRVADDFFWARHVFDQWKSCLCRPRSECRQKRMNSWIRDNRQGALQLPTKLENDFGQWSIWQAVEHLFLFRPSLLRHRFRPGNQPGIARNLWIANAPKGPVEGIDKIHQIMVDWQLGLITRTENRAAFPGRNLP